MLPYPILPREESFCHSPQSITHNRKFLRLKRYNNRPFSLLNSGEQLIRFNHSLESYLTPFVELNPSQRTNSAPNISLDIPLPVHLKKEYVRKGETKRKFQPTIELLDMKSTTKRKTSRHKRTAPKPPSTSQNTVPTVFIHTTGEIEMENK